MAADLESAASSDRPAETNRATQPGERGSMCGSCSTRDSQKRWRSPGATGSAVLVAVLVVLGIAGALQRSNASSSAPAATCGAAPAMLDRYEATMTRAMTHDSSAAALSDATAGFVAAVRGEGLAGCASIRRYVTRTAPAIEELCGPCASTLSAVAAAASASSPDGSTGSR